MIPADDSTVFAIIKTICIVGMSVMAALATRNVAVGFFCLFATFLYTGIAAGK